MIVEITKDSSKYGVRFPLVGEFYKVKPYRYDSEKVTLLYKVDAETYEKSKDQYWDEPMCNEYRYNLRIVSR